MLITPYHRAQHSFKILSFSNIDKLDIKLDIFSNGFLLLYAHDFLYSLSNVKDLNILSELAFLDLRKVQQILNNEEHKLRRRFLHFLSF